MKKRDKMIKKDKEIKGIKFLSPKAFIILSLLSFYPLQAQKQFVVGRYLPCFGQRGKCRKELPAIACFF